ncbi:helix-turn-helix transcriptional regulator [Hymenobacter sp. BT507]|uniref:Helix-turn-helix transcriptional regulator n=1 Tax=Hymenobacter citatus TaxID=2763506 RepID=A0ABR7MFN1_9BACT|nr:helix-turn-helix domain-containing protein [Hymenobacter citatus]MBC6609894.1 helix-turn-helix transcriptional regulator [Hymenobacter citatus]
MHVTITENQPITFQAEAKKILQNIQTATSICPVRHVLDRIGDKWSFLCILHLGAADTLRFNELRKQIGDVSQRMLTVTLRSLEADGLVQRHVYAEVPPRVEYQLTPLGHSLLVAFSGLGTWANAHAQEVAQARQAFAAREKGDG